ncbi:cobalamin-independent methionine synthase [Frankia sp. EI5c]|uniref:methionine synthase n=1 Tax=Frankia sp. EI5c TaxID=683316 RepID=UPI0007C2ECAE|nr:methionine synthase [Frankia sp. EI5c]OAA18771.1 cobalamin-independent methionine synthase [Frankia sp. EI5c]
MSKLWSAAERAPVPAEGAVPSRAGDEPGAQPALPWPPGCATGVGSLPGLDPDEAARYVLGEVPDLPFLPELPGRGAGADLIGRACTVLPDLPVDLQPSGWRLVPRPGMDLRRARDLMARDLDAFTEAAAGYSGPLKIAIAGPWTLAATVELPRGHRVLSDQGAARDLGEALAEGLAAHLTDLSRRVPGARLVVQLDEPSLPAALAGHLRTPSGFSVLPALEEGPAAARLAAVLGAAEAVGAVIAAGVHCCAPGVPIDLLRTAGARFVGLDATLLTRSQDDAVGEAVEAGVGLMLGLVPTSGADLSDPRRTVAVAVDLWRRLGFPPERLGEVVAVTPTCGLANARLDDARAVLRHCRQAARVLVESPE